MPDHDQRFKSLLAEFLHEFIRLFAPRIAERLISGTEEWLPQENFLDLFDGQKRTMDLVAKVSAREPIIDERSDAGQSNHVIIDLEVESRSSLDRLRPQAYEYYEFLRRRYRLPVLSLALLLNVALDGVGWDEYEDRQWDQPLVRFRYGYVGLPGLDGLEHLRSGNLLAVALSGLMRMPREGRAFLKAEALRRILTSEESEKRKELLTDCFETYFKLNEQEMAEFDAIRTQEPYREIPMVTSVWREQGRAEGIREGVLLLLEQKFGPLSPDVKAKAESLSLERAREIMSAILQAKSLTDLGLD